MSCHSSSSYVCLIGSLHSAVRLTHHRSACGYTAKQRRVGRPKHVRVMAGALEGDLFIGPKAEEHRGLLSVRYPMEHGIVKDWNDMERIWQYVYSKEQLQTFSEEHPVLLTEAPLNPSKNRERAAEVFFETFNVPALFISMQAVLSLYATGRTTGVVLDAGDGVTHAVPIYEGFAIPHSIMRVDIAGRDVSRYLRLLLRKEGYDFHTSAEFEVVRTIKERACYLSLNPQKDETLETEKAQYTLPDGSTLDIGPARFRAPELLFRPDLIGDESEGIHEVLAFAIQKSDMDLRRTLFSNIVLSGGSTLLKGFGDRLLSEVKKLAPKDVKIKISAPQERLYSTWIGGSILASLDTFKKMWVSKKEYEEDRARQRPPSSLRFHIPLLSRLASLCFPPSFPPYPSRQQTCRASHPQLRHAFRVPCPQLSFGAPDERHWGRMRPGIPCPFRTHQTPKKGFSGHQLVHEINRTTEIVCYFIVNLIDVDIEGRGWPNGFRSSSGTSISVVFVERELLSNGMMG
ncbi:Beta-centractin [Labeo rohita]|uniref:Beta-centractin n=1 Tax=Labeo rohita TaxID=84645 RepID=A0ABQ8MAB1_LABRO|nr:Beta-centractin [Labeo rohita]